MLKVSPDDECKERNWQCVLLTIYKDPQKLNSHWKTCILLWNMQYLSELVINTISVISDFKWKVWWKFFEWDGSGTAPAPTPPTANQTFSFHQHEWLVLLIPPHSTERVCVILFLPYDQVYSTWTSFQYPVPHVNISINSTLILTKWVCRINLFAPP